MAYWLDRGWQVAAISVLVLLAAMWFSLTRATAPMRSLFRALAGTTSSYRDGEYNFGVYWRGNDELAQLVQAHAELGDVLRAQRSHLVQRELMLDTMLQNTPVAMLLVVAGGDGLRRIGFSNNAARKLLYEGASWKASIWTMCSAACRPNCATHWHAAGTACSRYAKMATTKKTSRSITCRGVAFTSTGADTSCC